VMALCIFLVGEADFFHHQYYQGITYNGHDRGGRGRG
jgi:hypothetical protein